MEEEQHVIHCAQKKHGRTMRRSAQVRCALVLVFGAGLVAGPGCSSDSAPGATDSPLDASAESNHAFDAGADNTAGEETGVQDGGRRPIADASGNDASREAATDVSGPPADGSPGGGDAGAADVDAANDGSRDPDVATSDGPLPDATADGDGSDGARPIDTMAGAALTRGHHMGTAVKTDLLDSTTEPQFTTVLTTHFDTVVAEYQMKWGTTQATRGQFNFVPGDQIIDFASRHAMTVKGHTLVWHQSLPAWITALTQAEVGPVLDAHIAAVAGHWKGKLYAWDVVNEAIADDGSGYRTTSIFFQHLGAAFIERSFRAARAADPAALLFYNDYGAEGLNAKSNQVFTLVRDLKSAGVPIDGVGLQFHVNGAAPPPLADVAANLDRLIALGLIVNFSEIDIRVAEVPGTTAEKLATQRTLYHDIIALCAARPKCHSASTWGITDKYTWINDQYGPGHMPLPFDVDYMAKPAVAGVIDAWLGK
jgi:endo-1,4-beta-xylanase